MDRSLHHPSQAYFPHLLSVGASHGTPAGQALQVQLLAGGVGGAVELPALPQGGAVGEVGVGLGDKRRGGGGEVLHLADGGRRGQEDDEERDGAHLLVTSSHLRANEERVHGHDDAGGGHVRAHPLSDPGALPEGAHGPGLVPVQERGPHAPHVGARAHQKQEDGQKRLEVEDGRHGGGEGGSIEE